MSSTSGFQWGLGAEWRANDPIAFFDDGWLKTTPMQDIAPCTSTQSQSAGKGNGSGGLFPADVSERSGKRVAAPSAAEIYHQSGGSYLPSSAQLRSAKDFEATVRLIARLDLVPAGSATPPPSPLKTAMQRSPLPNAPVPRDISGSPVRRSSTSSPSQRPEHAPREDCPFHAIRNGNLALLRHMLLARADGAAPGVTQRTKHGCTPLHEACAAGWASGVQALLAAGAPLMAVNCVLSTPLHYAAVAGHHVVVRMLVTEGVRQHARGNPAVWSIDARDKHGCTALHYAAAYGAVKVIDVLLRHQASVDACTRGGATPLHHAASNGQEHSVRRLLTNNGNVNALDDNRSTALHLAAFYGHVGVARILLACGAQREILDTCGHTALHAACVSRAVDVVQLLEGSTEEHWSSSRISPRQHSLRRHTSTRGEAAHTPTASRRTSQDNALTLESFALLDTVNDEERMKERNNSAPVTSHIDDLGSPTANALSPPRANPGRAMVVHVPPALLPWTQNASEGDDDDNAEDDGGAAMDLFEYMCIRGEPHAQHLARTLSGDHTLRVLDLSGSVFGIHGVAYICRALCFNKTLRRLTLTSALRDTDDAIALSKCLEVNVTLQGVDVSDAQCGVHGLRCIADALAINTTLTDLALRSVVSNATEAQELCRGLMKNTGVEVLDLSYCRFAPKIMGPTGMRFLGKVLTSNRTLLSLNLTGSVITADDATALGDAIALNETLTSLNIGEHRLSKVASSILIDSLKKNTTIDAFVADEVFTRRLQNARRLDDAVAALYSNDARLSVVDLTACIETEVQGMDVVTALEQNTVVHSLTLKDNLLGEAVSRRLFEVLACNTTLTSLTLTGALSGDEEMKFLAGCIKTNTAISFLNVRGCPMSDSAVDALMDALRVNDTITRLRCDRCASRLLPLVHLNEKLCSAMPSLPLSEAASKHLETAPFGKHTSMDAQEYKACLFEAIDLCKYGWIRHILDMAPVVARCRREHHQETTQGELGHTLVLRKPQVHEPTLLRLFRSHFELDAYLAGLLETKAKLQTFERVLQRLSGEKWRDDEGNTVMHRILRAAHDHILRPSHVHGLCARLCELHPEHAFASNHKGITPIEMATLCGGRITQFFTPMVLLLVEERTRVVLDLDEPPDIDQDPLETVSHHALGFPIGATKPTISPSEHIVRGDRCRDASHAGAPTSPYDSPSTDRQAPYQAGEQHIPGGAEDLRCTSTEANHNDAPRSDSVYRPRDHHEQNVARTQNMDNDSVKPKTQKKWDLTRIFNRRTTHVERHASNRNLESPSNTSNAISRPTGQYEKRVAKRRLDFFKKASPDTDYTLADADTDDTADMEMEAADFLMTGSREEDTDTDSNSTFDSWVLPICDRRSTATGNGTTRLALPPKPVCRDPDDLVRLSNRDDIGLSLPAPSAVEPPDGLSTGDVEGMAYRGQQSLVIEVEKLYSNGRAYFLRRQGMKVYDPGQHNAYVGRYLGNGRIDFNAIDSSEDESDSDSDSEGSAARDQYDSVDDDCEDEARNDSEHIRCTSSFEKSAMTETHAKLTPATENLSNDMPLSTTMEHAPAATVRIVAEECEIDGTMYLVDRCTNKLYQRDGDNEFVGKLHGHNIDFAAEDSDEEGVTDL
eukprot:m.1479159 g.1479159  ORF g.1479159 m.1479159 type:complete len:1626 (-) comp25167_c0_seq8:2713-7590(-)